MSAFPPARDWDILVIGGGITGAGVLLEASRRGLKALLVEQADFGSGSSSRSSKLMHGGLRHLAAGSLRRTRAAAQERAALLRAAPGLVEAQDFVFANHGADLTRRLGLLSMLRVVDLLIGRREPQWQRLEAVRKPAPDGPDPRHAGSIRYTDAKTDDARLVVRVLDEARAHGAVACNYVTVQSLVRDGGKVHGALLHDARSQRETAVRARVVVDATGAPPSAPGAAAAAPSLRWLRGSHLMLAAERLPLTQAVSLLHPLDGRPVFAFPWEGATLVGTTDIEQAEVVNAQARITRPECDYLMTAVQAEFPQCALNEADVLATFGGVRLVFDGASAGAQDDRHEHLVWSEPGLVSVAGGTLTTFRLIACDVLREAARQLPGWQVGAERGSVFARAPAPARRDLPPGALRRLTGRHGARVKALLMAAQAGELECIPGTHTLWAELRWAARAEQVYQLDDLLLRRTRLGILLADGGAALLGRVRAICQVELGWDDARWEAQQKRYLAAWRVQHGVPPGVQSAAAAALSPAAFAATAQAR